ncbi:hypothetical protein CCYA_CCYA02G0792 [Cyanidiococcus yangmingshanensis]|nr:hypothetical protein CCYA_CCYA02G0792 [Cyanidiococcus yangmingshanensis]
MAEICARTPAQTAPAAAGRDSHSPLAAGRCSPRTEAHDDGSPPRSSETTGCRSIDRSSRWVDITHPYTHVQGSFCVPAGGASPDRPQRVQYPFWGGNPEGRCLDEQRLERRRDRASAVLPGIVLASFVACAVWWWLSGWRSGGDVVAARQSDFQALPR